MIKFVINYVKVLFFITMCILLPLLVLGLIGWLLFSHPWVLAICFILLIALLITVSNN